MQAHYDHAVALAEIKKISEAAMWATQDDTRLLEDGGFSDPHSGRNEIFKPVKVDKIISEGDVIECVNNIMVHGQKGLAHLKEVVSAIGRAGHGLVVMVRPTTTCGVVHSCSFVCSPVPHAFTLGTTLCVTWVLRCFVLCMCSAAADSLGVVHTVNAACARANPCTCRY